MCFFETTSSLKRYLSFIGVSFLVAVSGGCFSPKGTSATSLTPQLKRNIELVVREHMNVPATWTIVPENPKPSSIPGYNDEDVLFEDGDHQQIVRFLLSSDNQQLARLSNFSLTQIPGTKISTTDRPVRGSKDAPVEVIDFDDLECPFCERMSSQVLPGVLAHYKGMVKVVYKDFPLTSIHPWAMHAAIDADCLANQSPAAYWSYVDAVHKRHDEISGVKQNALASSKTLDSLALQTGHNNGLDLALLTACVVKQDQTKVEGSIQEGTDLEINSTPTIFVAGERLTGLTSDAMLRAAIDRALRAKNISPPQ